MKAHKLVSSCAALALALVGLDTAVAAAAQGADTRGKGWSLTHLDLDVWVRPAQELLELEGTVRMRLDALESSQGPNLMINMTKNPAGEAVMQFMDVRCDDADVNLRDGRNGWVVHIAEVRFDRPKRKGDEVTVSFAAQSREHGSQLLVQDGIAFASWTTGWHPFTNPTTDPGITFHAGTLHAPGRTRLFLPEGWVGLVDGTLVEREQSSDGMLEVWETPDGIARGFAAGPFAEVSREVDGREVRVYMLSDDKATGPERLARLVGDAMAAQEARLGPFPFDSYAVVEVPMAVHGQEWSAASQQTFILAKSDLFDYEHGNLPLWSHEMAHGWWGNTVGHAGPGQMFAGETLAQFFALVAIETLEGPEALHQFLAFSRDGFSSIASAAGYFTLLRMGEDQPIATSGSDFAADAISDSKGAWVYHMLRRVVGDEVFFGVLRGVIADYSHTEVTTAEIRRRFVAAAPDHDLRAFFAQWLDGTGAPILDVDWYATAEGYGVVLDVEQAHEGPPFAFDLDVELRLANGESVVRTVALSDAEHRFVLDAPARPVGVEVDPDYKILLWRPEYGPRPGDELGDEGTPADVVAAVVGKYREHERERDFDVFQRGDLLYIQLKGTPAVRLLYQGEGIFQVDMPGKPIRAQFDLSETPAPSFRALDEEEEHIAVRVTAER